MPLTAVTVLHGIYAMPDTVSHLQPRTRAHTHQLKDQTGNEYILRGRPTLPTVTVTLSETTTATYKTGKKS